MDTKNILDVAKLVNLLLSYDEYSKIESDVPLSSFEIRALFIIYVLEKESNNTPKKLAFQLAVSQSMFSNIVKKLECEGYVIKVKSTLDKRMTFITLTDLGIKVVKKYIQLHSEIYEEIYNIVGDTQLKIIENLIKVRIKEKRECFDW